MAAQWDKMPRVIPKLHHKCAHGMDFDLGSLPTHGGGSADRLSSTVAVPSSAGDPEGPPLHGLSLLTLERVCGRFDRAKQGSNHGKVWRFTQSRTWVLAASPMSPRAQRERKQGSPRSSKAPATR